jgi:hypothetical protein
MSTLPALIAATRSAGNASASTLRPRLSAIFGLTPGPTPPSFSPTIASCSRSLPPQKSSEPNVSKRNVRRPSSSMRCAFWLMVVSNDDGDDPVVATGCDAWPGGDC